MIEKDYIERTMHRDFKEKRSVLIAGNSIFYLGIAILISALIYMIVNITKADSVVSIWLPFVLAGIFLIFTSQLIKRSKRQQ